MKRIAQKLEALLAPPRTAAGIIERGILRGKTPVKILAGLKKALPRSKATIRWVAYYRRTLHELGVAVPTARGYGKRWPVAA